MATRRSNKRKQRDRGRFGALYKIFSLIIILVVVAAGCVVFFRVETITVDGEERYTAAEVTAASGVEQGDNLFLLDRLGIARRIMAELPYVENVNIRRAYPDGVIITVQECRAAAVIQGEDGDGWWLINTSGKILEQAASGDVAGTARIAGLTASFPAVGAALRAPEGGTYRLTVLLELMDALESQGMMEQVSSIDLSGTSSVLVDLNGWVTLEIGLTADFQEEMGTLKAILDSGDIQPNELGTIIKTQGDRYSFVPRES